MYAFLWRLGSWPARNLVARDRDAATVESPVGRENQVAWWCGRIRDPANGFRREFTRRRPFSAPLLLWIVVATSGVSRAEMGRPAARLFPLVEDAWVRSGTPTHLVLRVELPDGVHVQSNAPRDAALIPTTLAIDVPAGAIVEDVAYPAPSEFRQDGMPRPLAVFGPAFEIRVRLALAASVAPGAVEIRGRLRYQACDRNVCFPPAVAEATWSLQMTSPAEVGRRLPGGESLSPSAGTAAVATTAASVVSQVSATLVADVRAAIAGGDFAAAEQLVARQRAAGGVTPELLLANSWLGRGSLDARHLERAEAYARQTYELALVELKGRPLDVEPDLPIALGAAIEVLAKVAAERGARSDAVAFLRAQLAAYGSTSIHKRIQKNLHLLSLEGTSAPPLELTEYLGAKPVSLAALKGRVVLLFFWAHWCSDCKAQGQVLSRLLARYGPAGLSVVAPTQRFGYAAGGTPADRAAETRYIEQVSQTAYPWMASLPVPLSEANAQRYGVSTTPTLVLIDRAGLVRLYHPGQMTEAKLEELVRRLMVRPEN